MTRPPSPGRAAFYDAFRRYLADPGSGAPEHAAAFQRKVRESDMRYAGEPLDVAYFPLALADPDVARLGDVVERTLGLLERATARLLEQPAALADAFGWPEERIRVVRHDPGYRLAIPCARFDSYWDGSDAVKFLEVNTDGTSGMTNVERVTAFFLESPGVRALAGRFRLDGFELREPVLGALLESYAEHRRRGGGRAAEAPAEPRIAIVDWRTVKTSAEFRALVRYFEERGLRATIADPRDLRYDGRTLRDAGGEPVDLIYRRVVSTEYFAAGPGPVAAMTQAYLDGAACVVGSFRSDVAFDKRLMSLLTDPAAAERTLGLDAAERELAMAVFPRTFTLRPGAALEAGLRDRERLVLKPGGLYEGRGVRIGIETGEPDWRAALTEAAPAGDHVLQERVQPPELTVEMLETGRLEPRPLFLSLGEYAFGGRLTGFNGRVASTLVLFADDDERLLPVVRLRGSAAP